MIEVKQAVQVALDFVKDLYEKENLENFHLEEVELSEDEQYWLITVGFNIGIGHIQTHAKTIFNLGDTTVTRPERAYKVVKIDSEKGKALSLKIKKI